MTHPRPALITTPISLELMRGAVELEAGEQGLLPHRLPAWARAQCADPQFARAEAQPCGVRLVLQTEATEIELDVVPIRYLYSGAPPRPLGVYDLWVDGQLLHQCSAQGGDQVRIDLATGAQTCTSGPVATLGFAGLPARDKTVEIWLPYNETSWLQALRSNAPLAVPKATGRPVWLHHGSSISNGSNAASPTSIWPALAARLGQVELYNLGLAGNALLDPFTARSMGGIAADLISVKLGINLVNADLMRLRAFIPAVHGFLDTLRDGHPHTPLLLISPLYCPIHEHTPGPGAFDSQALAAGKVLFRASGDPAEAQAGKLTLIRIRQELQRIVEQRRADDPNLHYLDGLQLYGAEDFADLPLPDQLHPDDAAHQRIGQRFARIAFGTGGPLALEKTATGTPP